MGTDVVLRSTDVPVSFTDQMQMAKVLAESSLLPRHLRNQPANVLVVLSGARALDVPAFWALQSMFVVEGKLSMSAELMRALAIRAGHKVTVVKRTREEAIIEVQRKDKTKPYRVEFTWEDAEAAELTDKLNWKRYPKAMLVARATAIAVRDECADVLFGVVYTPEELGATVDEDGNPVVDGEIVEPPSQEDVNNWSYALSTVALAEIPVVWAEVLAQGATDAPAPSGDTLAQTLATRLGLEALDCQIKAHVRELWTLAQVCEVLDATVQVGEEREPLRSYLTRKADELPEQEETPDPVETENAQRLREQAAASWEETDGHVAGSGPGSGESSGADDTNDT